MSPDLAAQLLSLETPSIVGAFTYKVEAHDPERAVEVVMEVVERMRARSLFSGAKTSFIVASNALVEDEGRKIPLRRPDRGAAILSLETEGQLFAVSPSQPYTAERHAIDDALELAAPLNSGAMAPALSGSWAALEALLTDAQDSDQKDEGKVVAATNAALLVACSWPRAELTALSYQIDPGFRGRRVNTLLKSAESNRDRSKVIAEELRQNGGLPLVRSWRLNSDAAAIGRMNLVVADPSAALREVQGYVEASLRRLYRCRNVIVHGGSTRGDVLDATLRVIAPLVGAALDRVTHAHLVQEIDPLQLAARASIGISLASDGEAKLDVVDLIDRG